MDNEITITLIVAITTMMTIWGSIIVTRMSGKATLIEQQINANREMKRKYYNSFIEAFTVKLFYKDKPECIEKIESNMRFVMEANRLPLYASEEMVQFIEKIKNPITAKETKTEDFLVLLRKDLCDNSFDQFSKGKCISLTIPNQVTGTDIKGNKSILSNKPTN